MANYVAGFVKQVVPFAVQNCAWHGRKVTCRPLRVGAIPSPFASQKEGCWTYYN